MVNHLRFTQDLIRLRWTYDALRGEMVRPFLVHDIDRVLGFHRWLEGSGKDVILDFKKATELIADPSFDGDPVQIYEPSGDQSPVPPDEEISTDTEVNALINPHALLTDYDNTDSGAPGPGGDETGRVRR